MCRYVVGAAAALALSVGVGAPASAADLGVPPPAPVYTKAPPPAPAYSWTGFYVGGNVGYGWGNENGNWGVLGIVGNPPAPGAPCTQPAGFAFCPTSAASNQLSGALGGLQTGYNWQLGNYLAGVETDIQASGLGGSGLISGTVPFAAITGPALIPFSGTSSERLEWFGTLRGRLGFVSDGWLVYATGGLAYGEVRSQGTVNATGVDFAATRLPSCSPGGCPFELLANWSASQTRFGWSRSRAQAGCSLEFESRVSLCRSGQCRSGLRHRAGMLWRRHCASRLMYPPIIQLGIFQHAGGQQSCSARRELSLLS
jgi:outer membrane immunogenic protein